MANKHSVEGARTSKQFKRAVTKQGGWVETGGKHPKFCHPDGGKAPYPSHSRDLATGTRHALIKQLIALGFMVLPFVCALVWLITL